MMKSSRYSLLVVAFIMMALLVSGCDNNPSAVSQNPGATPSSQDKVVETNVSKPETEIMRIVVYHATSDAMYVAPDVQSVPRNEQPARTALDLLLKGTQNPQLISVIPEGTKVKHFWIKDQVAYVDFNDKIIKNSKGGSASELLLVASIVNTLTEFPTIAKVQLLVEGKHVESISGHVDVSEPLSRAEKSIKKSL